MAAQGLFLFFLYFSIVFHCFSSDLSGPFSFLFFFLLSNVILHSRDDYDEYERDGFTADRDSKKSLRNDDFGSSSPSPAP